MAGTANLAATGWLPGGELWGPTREAKSRLRRRLFRSARGTLDAAVLRGFYGVGDLDELACGGLWVGEGARLSEFHGGGSTSFSLRSMTR